MPCSSSFHVAGRRGKRRGTVALRLRLVGFLSRGMKTAAALTQGVRVCVCVSCCLLSSLVYWCAEYCWRRRPLPSLSLVEQQAAQRPIKKVPLLAAASFSSSRSLARDRAADAQFNSDPHLTPPLFVPCPFLSRGESPSQPQWASAAERERGALWRGVRQLPLCSPPPH